MCHRTWGWHLLNEVGMEAWETDYKPKRRQDSVLSLCQVQMGPQIIKHGYVQWSSGG